MQRIVMQALLHRCEATLTVSAQDRCLLPIYGPGHFWLDDIFLRPGTSIFQVPPGNYQGVPEILTFLWPIAVFLTVPIDIQ